MSDQPVPLEKRADKVKRDLVRDYDADGVERKPRRTISELEQQLAAAEVALSEVQQERERIGQHLLTSIEQRDESTRRFIESDESAYQLQQQVAQQAATIHKLRELILELEPDADIDEALEVE